MDETNRLLEAYNKHANQEVVGNNRLKKCYNIFIRSVNCGIMIVAVSVVSPACNHI